MKPLANNTELYEYLLHLGEVLKYRLAAELGKVVVHAGRSSVGMSTEFLGESRIALRKVLKEENGILTGQEREDLSDVLKQLGEAFEK